jgi:acetyl-CoA acetyltransferase
MLAIVVAQATLIATMVRRFTDRSLASMPLPAQHTSEFMRLYRQGRLKEAETLARAAVRADRKNVQALQVLGLIDIQRGWFDDAAIHFERLGKLLPGDPQARCQLGHARMGQGRLDDAIEAFDQALQLDPGNASAIRGKAVALERRDDAAAALRLLEPLAELVAYGEVAGPDTSLLTQPSRATTVALERAGMDVGDVDLFEFNEAFAAVALASMADLSLPDDVVNVNGGAIALGHPLGATGAKLMTTLLHELERTGGRYGLQTMCEGGGQANVTIIERL